MSLERCLGPLTSSDHDLFLGNIGHIPGGKEPGDPRFIGAIYLNLTKLIEPGDAAGHF